MLLDAVRKYALRCLVATLASLQQSLSPIGEELEVSSGTCHRIVV